MQRAKKVYRYRFIIDRRSDRLILPYLVMLRCGAVVGLAGCYNRSNIDAVIYYRCYIVILWLKWLFGWVFILAGLRFGAAVLWQDCGSYNIDQTILW